MKLIDSGTCMKLIFRGAQKPFFPAMNPLPSPSSSASVGGGAANHHRLAERCISLLLRLRCPDSSLAADFTPEAAFHALVLSQPHRHLFLSFLNWASHFTFFSTSLLPQSLALLLLLRFRLLPRSFSLSRRLASDFPPQPLFTSLHSSLSKLHSPLPSSCSPFDLLVKSYASLSRLPEAFSALSLTKAAGFAPSLLSYNSILDAMFRKKTSLDAVEAFLTDMAKSRISLNVYSYNILIRGYCSRGDLARGFWFLDEMTHAGCSPNCVTYNTLVDACCKSRRIENAFELVRLMRLAGLRPNLITYNSLVNGLCRERRLAETHKVLDEMMMEGLTPDTITYNTMVNGYCQEGNVHQALLLYDEMGRKGVAPNVVTYTSLISVMCRAGNLERAMDFAAKMKERGLQLNEITFTTLIDGFCRKGYLDDGILVMKEMKESGIVPSVVCYNALINGYCTLGRMDEALEIVRDLEGKGLTPDVVTYSTIFSGYCRNGDMKMAFQLNQEMLGKGVLPDAISYSSLIKGLCEARRLDDAFEQFEKMLRLGLCPDEFTYTTLINGYCKEGDMDKALILHDEMISKGILPDVVTYSVLINGLDKVARTKEAKKLLFRLYYEEVIPDDVKYDALMKCCKKTEFKSVVSLLKSFCMKGLMNEADKVFESIIERNWKPDGAVYSILIHGHCRGGNLQKALHLHQAMLQAGFIPNAISTISLIKCLSEEGRNEESNQVIQELLSGCSLTDAETSKVLVDLNHNEGNMEAVLEALTRMAKDGLLPSSG